MTSDPERRAARAPLVVGVLGGIASGKSLVARVLRGPDGVLVDADALAHAVLGEPDVVELVRARFGAAAIGPDGRPDRAVLGRRVFSDAAARAALEGWIHPRVRDRMHAVLASAAGRPIAVLDVPLLLENDAQHGLVRLVDVLVFVDAPADERDARAQRNRGWPSGEVARREALQLPLSEKRARADVVLANGGTAAELERAATRLRAELLADRS
jgi:dephospho-CoA kinase